MGIILMLAALSFLAVPISSGVGVTLTNASFAMSGTITNILSPASIVVDGSVVNLEGVDSSGLYRFTYAYLIEDLKENYLGKDVFVKGNYVYLDLQGAYNAVSINEMIQKEISDMQLQQDYGTIYGWTYESSSYSSSYSSS
jgi:hypothetical protein